MEKLLRQISDKFVIFHVYAWEQAERGNYPAGQEAAVKSRTASMELGALLEEWRKESLECQADKVELP